MGVRSPFRLPPPHFPPPTPFTPPPGCTLKSLPTTSRQKDKDKRQDSGALPVGATAPKEMKPLHPNQGQHPEWLMANVLDLWEAGGEAGQGLGQGVRPAPLDCFPRLFL